MIIIFSLIHYHSLWLGASVQNGLTIFKIGLIVVFVVAGLWLGRGSINHFSGGLDMSSVFQDKFAVSLIFISFAYSGWNAVAYLGGEIKRPSRNIPLALFTGTFLVIFSGAIAIGLLSVLSAMIMTGPRVYYAMAKDGVFFELFGNINKVHRTPAYAIFLQAAIAIVMVVTASFDKLLIYIGFTLALCATLTVAGMILLRITQPALKRDYKTFGYPVTPFLFILGNLWIIYFSIRSRPIASLFGLGTIGLGILVYLYFSIRRGQNHDV
jgi:APA family basic amino acid/polyamine antiporter